MFIYNICYKILALQYSQASHKKTLDVVADISWSIGPNYFTTFILHNIVVDIILVLFVEDLGLVMIYSHLSNFLYLFK